MAAKVMVKTINAGRKPCKLSSPGQLGFAACLSKNALGE